MGSRTDGTLPGSVLTGPLVGREAELSVVWARLKRARSGRGQVLGLTGAPGMGKSRLAAEILRLGQGLGFAVHSGACRPGDETTAYLVWQPIWRALLGLDPSLPATQQEARLAARVAAHDGGSSQRTPLLAPVVNLPMSDSELTAPLDTRARSEFLRSLLLDLFRASAASTPLVLVLEDCHWIDPTSLELLELLASNVAAQPVLIVATSRPTDAAATAFAPLAHLGNFTDIPVPRLPVHDAERLVTQRIRSLRHGQADVPRTVVRRIVASAGGNPLHLEELVSFLLAEATGPWIPRALAGPDLPDDLWRLVSARTDRLGVAERTTIEVASVIGARFSAGWIWGSYPSAGPPEQVLRHLERLAELELVRRYPAGDKLDYEFKHAVTREAVYERLPAGRRETLHRCVARFIERTYPDRLTELVDLLAHHYGETSDVVKKRRWFRAAADAAKAAFATEAAIGHYDRLLELLAPEDTGELLIELGDLLLLTARWTRAERAYRRALRVAASTGDRRVLAEGHRGLGSVIPYTQSDGWELRDAAGLLGLAVDEFDELQDGPGLAKALERLAWTSWELAEYSDALEASDRHLEIAREAGDAVGVSAALGNLGLVHWHTGEHEVALEDLQQALEAATRAGYRPGEIRAANDLASVRSERGDHVNAIRDFWKALRVAQEIGDRRNVTLVMGNIGESHRRQGEYGRALRCFADAFRIAVEIGDRVGMTWLAGNLATTMAAQGRQPEAELLLDRAVTLARQLDARYWLCESLHQQALLLATAGRLDQAALLNEEALDIASRHDLGRIRLRASLLSIRLQVALGRMERSDAMEELQELRWTWSDAPEQATILDALWQLDPTQEQLRWDAAELYGRLYREAPTVEHRKAYKRLTGGASLPHPRSLPGVPNSISRKPLDLPKVLEQLDQAIRGTSSAYAEGRR